MRKFWKQWETDFLQKYYETKDKDFLINGLNRSWAGIKEKAKKLNLSRRNFSNLWTENEDNYLIKNYKLTDKKHLIENLNKTWISVIHRANRLNLKRLIKGDSNCNLQFFNTWSNEMAYVLGFIAADGCIYFNKKEKRKKGKKENSKTLEIHLSHKDINHLEKIKNLLSPARKIKIQDEKHKNGKIYKTCSLKIGSRYFCDTLINKGIIPRKSLTLEFPDVPIQYLNHFVRGYFDGDGWICLNTSKSKIKQLGFCSGSAEFIKQLNCILSNNIGIGIRKVSRKVSRKKI